MKRQWLLPRRRGHVTAAGGSACPAGFFLRGSGGGDENFVVTSLEQKDFEHGERRIRGIANGVTQLVERFAQKPFQRVSIDGAIKFVAKALIAFATENNGVGSAMRGRSALTPSNFDGNNIR